MTSLNNSHRRSILLTFLDLHRRMAEMEAVLAQSLDSSPFSQHVNDLSPTERKVVQDYFARIRSTMLAGLEELGIPLEVRRTSLRWYLQCGMAFLDVALAEMGPGQLRGYGPLDPPAQQEVVKIRQDIDRLLDRVGAYLRQGLGKDLAQRLTRLEAAPATVADLKLLDAVITRWQLVEFRPQLDTIVRRLESPQFEIAVFGRVSSGKSTLLNHIAGMDVLPVGVTPITAVPTRLVRGAPALALISFAEIEPKRIDVQHLRDYASEEGNPGNHKHVTNILVQVPSVRLREGVVLVDTPGIGSLALSGSAETFAYLPRCDLGVVLIDAASAVNQDDLDLLRLLTETGIPVQVLISKADLLTSQDRDRMRRYIQDQIRREVNLDLAVHPVSTIGVDEALLTQWFKQQIAPLWDRHRALTEASLRRKIAHLRESVVAVLQTLLSRQQGQDLRGGTHRETQAAGQLLGRADDAIQQAQLQCRDWWRDEPGLMRIVYADVAQAVVERVDRTERDNADPALGVLKQVLLQRCEMAHKLVTGLQRTLVDTLESLQRMAPLAYADRASVENLVFRGLPVLDLSPLQGKVHASPPWWARFLRQPAVWAVRRALEKKSGATLDQFLTLYDRQLQAWIKSCMAQLVEAYEAQAEVFREQIRRFTVQGNGADLVVDQDRLLADLRALQGDEPEGKQASAMTTATSRPHTDGNDPPA